MSRSFEHWVALLGGALFVFLQHKEKTAVSRVIIAAVSAAIGYALAPELAQHMGRSETLAVMLLTAFGYVVLDGIGALLADREWLKEIIKAKVSK